MLALNRQIIALEYAWIDLKHEEIAHNISHPTSINQLYELNLSK